MSRNRTRTERRRYRRRRTSREPEEDTIEHNHSDVNEQEESSRDIDSSFAIASASPRLQYASKSQDRRLIGSKWNHVVDPQTAQVTWATSKYDCQAPRRTPGNIHLQLETSDINQAERVSEAKKTSHEMGRRHQRILTTSQKPQRQQRSHERSD